MAERLEWVTTCSAGDLRRALVPRPLPPGAFPSTKTGAPRGCPPEARLTRRRPPRRSS